MTVPRMVRSSIFAALFTCVATAASAQVVQSVHIGVGAFLPRSFDLRADGDVLVADLTTTEPLFFNVKDFQSAHAFGEWLVAVGPHIEFGAGLGYYNRSVPSVYQNLVNGAAGDAEISQTLRLRVVPVTGLVRFLPFGRPGSFQPYAGVGVSALNWRYSEVGDFVDLSDFSIFNARFRTQGTAVAPVVMLGARMPVGGDVYAFTMEWRNQFGTGDTGGAAKGFLGDKIDLGGSQLNFGLLVRF